MFSRRLPWERAENPLARLQAEKRAAGAALIDLTQSNPTQVGIEHPVAEIAAALAASAEAGYEPAPRGLRPAREAVAAEYRRIGAAVNPDSVVLTASSSESYAYLLKLLCDPGDAILVPEPSYPLLEYLARLEGVELRGYRLDGDAGWRIDFDSLASAAGAIRARAVVTVSPNNPTGSLLLREDLDRLRSFCAEEGLALLADEVFAAYAAPPGGRRRAGDHVLTVAGEEGPTLTFALGGLSKACGFPQLKLGWIVVSGAAAAAALGRLDLIADTYLSVSAPVQVALPQLFSAGARVRAQIRDRLAWNRAALSRAFGPVSPCTVLPSEGGWSAIVRVPATRTDEEWALALLREDDVLAHPGYFFDMPRGSFLVLSLLPEPSRFARGVARIAARCRA